MRKTNNKTTAPAMTNAERSVHLAALDASLPNGISLTNAVRKRLANRAATAPEALIEEVLRIASNNDGLVVGMPLDVEATTALLADAKAARAAAASSRMIARKLEDDAVAKEVVVADRVFAIYKALRRLVQTPEGNSLLRSYGEMASTVRRARAPRKTPKAEATAPVTPPESGTKA